MIAIVINGESFDYPEIGDREWGDAATTAFQALASTTLQAVKDSNDPTVVNNFTLYNDIDFGRNKGLRVLYVTSNSNDPAASGVYRLSNGELVAWRNNGNDSDNYISFDSDNDLIVNGVKVTLHGQIVNSDIAAAAGIEESKLALDYSTDSLHTAIDTHVNNTSNPHLTNLVNLVDTSIVTPNDNDMLLYDGNSSKWKNKPFVSNVAGAYIVDYKKYLGVNYTPYISYSSADGYFLTFTAGDIILDPQGNETVLTSNVVLKNIQATLNDQYVFYSPSQNELIIADRMNCVESPTSPAFATIKVWYDTTNNRILAGKGATSWSDTVYNDLSIPLCIVSTTDSVYKIKTLFDSFCSYFLQTIFFFPSTKVLIPKGKKSNGKFDNDIISLFNNQFTTHKINSYYKGNTYSLRVDTSGDYVYAGDTFKNKLAYVDDELPMFQYTTAFDFIFSYKYNSWFFRSGFNRLESTNAIGFYIHVTLSPDATPYIMSIEEPAILSDEIKGIVDEKINYTTGVYVAEYYPEDSQPSSHKIIMQSYYHRNQYITKAATTYFDIYLPYINVRKGEIFTFTFEQDPVSTINFCAKSSSTLCTQVSTYNKYEFIALVDTPITFSDWLVIQSKSVNTITSDLTSHISNTSNPHSVTKSQILTGNLIVNADVDSSAGIEESKLTLDYSTSTLNSDIGTVSGDLTNHTSNTSNPHSVTKSQVLSGDLIVDSDVDVSAAILESKLALDYSTSTLNTDIGNVSGDLTTHTSDTANPHSTSIDNLNDTTIDSNTLAVDDVLVYNDQTEKWENSQVMINHIGSTANPHLTTVGKLTDVNIDNDTLANGDILTYDSQNLVWKNTVNSGGGGGGDSRFANISGTGLVEFKKYLGVTNPPSITKSGANVNLTFYKDDIMIDPLSNETTLSANVVLNITSLSTTDEYLIFYSPSQNELLYATRSNIYEKNTDPAFSTSAIYYNYNTNVIKAGKGATSWSDTVYTDLTLPLCVIKDQKIVTLFDYFGSFILSYFYLYPGTKYLKPEGKNTDGTFKNSVVSINSGNIQKCYTNSYYKGSKYPLGQISNGTFGSNGNFLYKILYIDESIPAAYNLGVFQNSSYGFQYAFSYSDNQWYSMSSGKVIKATGVDFFLYVTLDSTGNIIELERPDIISSENKFLNDRKIKKDEIYYADSYPQDRTPNSSNVILSTNDNKNHVILSGAGCNVVLPCLGVKRGDRYSFTYVNNPSSNVVVQSFTRATITTITTSGGNTEYCFIAKCDMPGGSSDWLGFKKSITTL